ncbi:hypothetical protein [Arcobacter sp. F2176]|uniref:hypothetical protein n=1 Tax=Arcobacter sp. F2176 TaxID=2044511 RepID=UPI00100C2E4C|nr:hypothetical protein [Arcobacter sp. F2176]RXJ82651.1 hypothetical protein CRU95_00890 [Arcobacter sp. F2176]
MNFKDIKEFTYFDNQVIVDGVQHEIDVSLVGISAVQFHKGFELREESSYPFKKVPFTKYQYALDKWKEVDDSLKIVIDNDSVEDVIVNEQ